MPDRTAEEALAVLHRSVSAWQFYPQNHPMLAEAMADGYRAWQRAAEDHRLAEPGLQLRSGALWLGEEQLGQGSPAVGSLARTFAAHGVMTVRRRDKPLSLDGFRHLVSLLAASPELLRDRAGLVEEWRRSPYGNALELRGLHLAAGEGGTERRRRPSNQAREWGTALADGGEASALADPLLLGRLQAFRQRSPRERRVLDLLLRLGRTDDIARFLDILREVTRLVEEYLDVERYREPFHVVLYLYREAQNMEVLGKEGKRDYLLDTIRLLLRGEFLQWLIDHVASARGDEEAEVGEYILRVLGKGAAIPLINALVAEKSRAGRRRLVEVLVSIGEPVLPWVVRMLDDQRWYVVRNMVTILGGIGSPEAAKALIRLAEDPDGRIRKEVARSLGRVGGPAAEARLTKMLGDRDTAVRQMAVGAAATVPKPEMLEALWRVFWSIPVGSAEWELKVTILQAIGRLGLPEAVASLEALLGRGRVFHRGRWTEVKRAALQALGDLGGERAREILQSHAGHRNSELRLAAVRALAVAGSNLGSAP